MKNLFPFLIAVISLASCSKKDPEPGLIIDSPTIDLNYDKNHQFVLKKGTEDVFASTLKWRSSDEKVGTVDANGLFKGRKIGETTISGTADNGGIVESKVTIKPYVTIFTEPVTDFGSTIASVKSKEKRKMIGETADGMAFEGSLGSQTRAVMYLFTNGKLTSSLILFENSTSTVTTSSTFIKERYPDRVTDSGKVYILNDARTMAIIMSVDASLGYNALYMPYTKGGRMDAAQTENMKPQILELSKFIK